MKKTLKQLGLMLGSGILIFLLFLCQSVWAKNIYESPRQVMRDLKLIHQGYLVTPNAEGYAVPLTSLERFNLYFNSHLLDGVLYELAKIPLEATIENPSLIIKEEGTKVALSFRIGYYRYGKALDKIIDSRNKKVHSYAFANSPENYPQVIFENKFNIVSKAFHESDGQTIRGFNNQVTEEIYCFGQDREEYGYVNTFDFAEGKYHELNQQVIRSNGRWADGEGFEEGIMPKKDGQNIFMDSSFVFQYH